MSTVIWHDLECGAYRQDLGFWLRLVAERGGPVLDVGAGTGRVALALARTGVEVMALDADAELLGELARRSDGLPLRTVLGDARDFSVDERFPLVVVPMQTVQLLGGAEGRVAFLRCAARHLAPGGLLAMAIAEQFEVFDVGEEEGWPLPDIQELQGVVYSSQPTAVRRDGERYVLERRRETVDPAGAHEVSRDVIALDRVSARELEREGRAAGLRRVGVAEIEPTVDHIGSRVVMLGA
jgi:SAM-dependent methyltransferase